MHARCWSIQNLISLKQPNQKTNTMQDLVNELVTKAGLTQEQAEKSIEVIKNYIQSQLPPMMQGMVDNFLGQQGNNDKIGE